VESYHLPEGVLLGAADASSLDEIGVRLDLADFDIGALYGDASAATGP